MPKRSAKQCKKPTLKTSRTPKCEFHGGRSTGPKTETCEAKQGTAPPKDEKKTKEALDDRARNIRVLAGLEDALYVFNMASTPRTRGRKPERYMPLHAVEDVLRFATDNPLHSPRRIRSYGEDVTKHVWI
jgi:hypothetical protein